MSIKPEYEGALLDGPVGRGRVRTLRRFYWRHLRRHNGETCDRCGRAYWHALGETWWAAQDDLWAHVVGPSTTKCCPACFTREARRKGLRLHWEPALERVEWLP